jgi:type I restriction enzyme M protein
MTPSNKPTAVALAPVVQEEINNTLWKMCDTFRGMLNATDYKKYILVMLFVKYISDVWAEHYDALTVEFKGNSARIRRRLERDRFMLPVGASYQELYEQREQPNIGEIINTALEAIEDSNRSKLAGVFRGIDFNNEYDLGETKERSARLKSLLEEFADPRLNLRPSRVGKMDVIGNAYEFLIGKFAAGAGKKAGEYYTPPEVSELIAEIIDPQPGDRICDPTCGSGSLLIRCGNQLLAKDVKDFALFGQEINQETWALAKMNMFVHGMDGALIERGDTIRSPKLVENGQLLRFEVVVANPPFSLDKWGTEIAEADTYNRFFRGLPPKTKGDFAFISHMIETTTAIHGRVAVVVPHGVLFRGSAEGRIRSQLIDENLLDAVIGLPGNLFFGTGIPAAILVFKRSRSPNAKVLFIDASRDYLDGKNQNKLRPQDLKKIVTTYRKRSAQSKYSALVSLQDIAAQDFNLNIPRYVDTFEAEAEIDIQAVQAEIDQLETELKTVQKEMAGYLTELGMIAKKGVTK